MISVGGLVLNPSMLWLEQGQSKLIISKMFSTLGGRAKVMKRTLLTGQKVTLQAVQDQGWLTWYQVRMLLQMEKEGGIYSLVIGDYTPKIALFGDSQPAVDFTLKVQRPFPEDSDFCTGTLRMITV